MTTIDAVSDGGVSYRLVHESLGELGRLILKPGPRGRGCLISYEIWSGDQANECRRIEILGQLERSMITALAGSFQTSKA
ncbi:hypothetical protein G5S34_04580 [Herbaspirillum frisingense]|uniref:hypothetical protein n=1 Tax=Herbaspirillum frisingense TaxID=92645 RepID=UPI0015FFF533|nr:hypothetical protein [Herbaspirillum frisingense]QNB06116.1 hypothetical protein G5S34_04580 [Herbaspirillum frisingense]